MKYDNAWIRAASLTGLVALASGCDRTPDRTSPVAATPPPASGTPAIASPAPAPSPPAAAAESQARADWLGQWTGPEGTALTLSRKGDGFDIVIRSLDGTTPYVGFASDDGIEFERNGRMEMLRASDGAGTGMKWLAEKTDCLVINPGEGFCRD